ncbi:MAG: hypothetical protein LBB93_02350, partial [Elusimicrobiota bacterium]|nr:hypothetical protein [Elusimicrobiota bacterium]
MAKKSYWCYRIDKNKVKFFWNELSENRLRQGWGWLKEQDLRNFKKDEGAGRNRPMFNNVKKGDILLVPHLPSGGEIAIVEATQDWNIGYKFEIDENLGDYGHIFPAKYLKKFSRHNENVSGNIRSTLKNPSRFWNINHYAEDVEKLLETEDSELSKKQDYESRLESSIGSVFYEIFDESKFSEKLYSKLKEQFTREEWEFALVHGIRQIFPFYHTERVGGGNEKNHGTDILIRIPSIMPDYEYAIAIQVKDYEGFVADDVIKQINKADKWWNAEENVKLIEKIVVITRAEKDDNINLIENDSGVKFIFAKELMQLLSNIGQTFIGIKS